MLNDDGRHLDVSGALSVDYNLTWECSKCDLQIHFCCIIGTSTESRRGVPQTSNHYKFSALMSVMSVHWCHGHCGHGHVMHWTCSDSTAQLLRSCHACVKRQWPVAYNRNHNSVVNYMIAQCKKDSTLCQSKEKLRTWSAFQCEDPSYQLSTISNLPVYWFTNPWCSFQCRRHTSRALSIIMYGITQGYV